MKVGIAAPNLGPKELEYVTDAVKSGWVSSSGSYVKRYAEAFAKYIGTKHAFPVSNGTTALHLAMAACIAPGDEVIMPATTMIACANVVKYCGGVPVFVDIEEDTWCIDPHEIGEAITGNTSAIMPVHLYGHPAAMDEILAIADNYDLWVIEDAAEAHGAEYKGKKVGGIGNIGCFSTYGNKIITTGEGGMVVTNDDYLAERVESLMNQGYDKGKRKLLIHKEIGFNYRLTNIQCALGLAQLERIDEFIDIHRANAKRYTEALEGVREVVTPFEAEWAKNVYWMYTMGLFFGSKISRNDLMDELAKVGVDTRAAFPPLYRQPPYQEDERMWCQVAEWLGNSGLNLPSGNSTTEEEVDYVIEKIIEVMS